MMTKSALNDYINDIKYGMSDCDAIRAICARYIADRAAACTYKCVFYRIVNQHGVPCRANGDVITDEPPLGVLSNLNAAHIVTATLRGNLVAIWTFFDWRDVNADDLARCIINDDLLFIDAPAEFVEDPEEDDPAAALAAAKKRLVESVLYAVDEENNESDDDLRYTDPCDVAGDNYSYVFEVAQCAARNDWSNYRYEWRAWNDKGKATDGAGVYTLRAPEVERSTVIYMAGKCYIDKGDELIQQVGVAPTGLNRDLNRCWVRVSELTASEIEEYEKLA